MELQCHIVLEARCATVVPASMIALMLLSTSPISVFKAVKTQDHPVAWIQTGSCSRCNCACDRLRRTVQWRNKVRGVTTHSCRTEAHTELCVWTPTADGNASDNYGVKTGIDIHPICTEHRYHLLSWSGSRICVVGLIAAGWLGSSGLESLPGG